MKKRRSSIPLLIMFLVGVSLLLYPSLSNYVNAKSASRVIATYNEALAHATQEDFDYFFAQANAYNQKISSTPDVLYNAALVDGYDEALDITGTGVMGILNIPKIKVELPVYHTVSDGVLQIAAGHLPGTSLPIGGESTHCVLSGHRGLPSARLFTDLNELVEGDFFTITVLDKVLTYQVDQIRIVLPTQTDDLLITKGEDYCTLLTCTPYGINSHRLLVRGRRVADAEEIPSVFIPNEAFRFDTLTVALILAVPLLLLLILITVVRDIVQRCRRSAKQTQPAALEDETADHEGE